ncbi:MAG: diacylglycerol kinase [Cellvibrio sp.]|nr:diacylglycerol kinase [Cellvibrio sp.]
MSKPGNTGIARLSGRAKDIGSALVFVSLVLLGLVWAIVALNRFCPNVF